MNKEPTQEQWVELLEWCGFKFFEPVEGGAIDVLYPDGSLCLSSSKMAVPPMDLNILFEYAVPKLCDTDGKDRGSGVQVFLRLCDGVGWTVKGWMSSVVAGVRIANIEGEATPALALFWAIWQVKED